MNFASESALIEFDENLISEENIVKAVKDIGYTFIISRESVSVPRLFDVDSAFLETISLKVLGMDSAHCAMMVEQAIGKLAGIDKIDADFPNQRAKIVFDPKQITPDEIFKVIIDIGYKPIKETGDIQDFWIKRKLNKKNSLEF